jgi:hypothetical protein
MLIQFDSIEELDAFLAICRGERPGAERIAAVASSVEEATERLQAAKDAATPKP